MLHAFTAAHRDLRQAQHVFRQPLQVVQRHHLAGVLQQIQHVVHRIDQPVDLVAVQRRDEGAMQKPVHLGGDLVGCVFGLVDQRRAALALGRVVVVPDHGQKGPGAIGDALAVLVEQLEEISLAGQKPSEHHDALPSVTQQSSFCHKRF
jgi:hypothetical protein